MADAPLITIHRPVHKRTAKHGGAVAVCRAAPPPAGISRTATGGARALSGALDRVFATRRDRPTTPGARATVADGRTRFNGRFRRSIGGPIDNSLLALPRRGPVRHEFGCPVSVALRCDGQAADLPFTPGSTAACMLPTLNPQASGVRS